MGRKRVEFSRNWIESVATRARHADPGFLPAGNMVNRWLNFAGLPSRLSWFIPKEDNWDDLGVRLDVAHEILSRIAPCVMNYDGVGPFVAAHVSLFADMLGGMEGGHDYVLRSCSLLKDGRDYTVTVTMLDRDVGRPRTMRVGWTVAHNLAMRHEPLLERQLSGYDMEGVGDTPARYVQQP